LEEIAIDFVGWVDVIEVIDVLDFAQLVIMAGSFLGFFRAHDRFASGKFPTTALTFGTSFRHVVGVVFKWRTFLPSGLLEEVLATYGVVLALNRLMILVSVGSGEVIGVFDCWKWFLEWAAKGVKWVLLCLLLALW
jgi:hypothetical protein